MKRIILIFVLLIFSCSGSSNDDVPYNDPNGTEDNDPVNNDPVNNDPVYADIDFSNWKLTLPVDEDNNDKPDEYQPSALVDYGYQTNESIQPFMYDDESDSSIVFYTYPDVTTPNSSYSRTELRELINPSNSRENWTLLEGGTLTGRLKMVHVSENPIGSSYDHPKVIIMQIHGIVSEEDMALHGFSSNNGPPLIKMTWIDGYLWSYKKSLVDESTEGDDLLINSSDIWSDIKHNMGYVGYEPFDLQIVASDGKLEIKLNNENPLIYEDISLEKWPFENYFKAGNYLGSTDDNASSTVKYYELSVSH